jgi:hypothetical protein
VYLLSIAVKLGGEFGKLFTNGFSDGRKKSPCYRLAGNSIDMSKATGEFTDGPLKIERRSLDAKSQDAVVKTIKKMVRTGEP